MGNSSAAAHIASSSLPSEHRSSEEERRAKRSGMYRVPGESSLSFGAWQACC